MCCAPATFTCLRSDPRQRRGRSFASRFRQRLAIWRGYFVKVCFGHEMKRISKIEGILDWYSHESLILITCAGIFQSESQKRFSQARRLLIFSEIARP